MEITGSIFEIASEYNQTFTVHCSAQLTFTKWVVDVAQRKRDGKTKMGSQQVQRLQSLLHAQKEHDEAQAAVEKCVAAGALSPREAATQQAQATAALKGARAEAGFASKDAMESDGGCDEGEPEGNPQGEGVGHKRGRQPGQKFGKYAARTRIDDLGINTLRAVCDDLGLTNRLINEAEMMTSIHKASGATAKVQKTNLDALSVETLKRICAERKLKVEDESDKTVLINWIQNGAASAKKVAREDENKFEKGTPSDQIQQPVEAKARPMGAMKEGMEGAGMALAAEDKPKKVRAATSYNLFMKDEIVRLKGADLSLEHKLAFKQAAANWATQKQPSGAGVGDDAPGASQQGEITDTKCNMLQLLEEFALPGSDDDHQSAANADAFFEAQNMQGCSAKDAVAQSWHGAREISRPVPRSHWAHAINKVLQQIHPGYSLSEDGMLMMTDLVDWWLHLIVTEAEQVVLSFDSQLSDMRGGPIPAHQILAHRVLPRDAFLISFEEEEPTWEVREDALLAGINLASFEARPVAEVAEAYERFCDGDSGMLRPSFCADQDFIADALTSRHIETALRLVLPGELAKHAVSESTKAITRFTSNSQRTRTARAGLQFPVDVVGSILVCGRTVAPSAPVYLAATLEYLAAEVLELGGNAAKDNTASAISVRHIALAVSILSLVLAAVMIVHC